MNGFAVPLREEHCQFLLKTLLPLHTHRSLSLYYSQLAFCVLQFVEKDPRLADPVITYLCRHWPKHNSQKEVMLWGEVEEILETSLELTEAAVLLLGKQLAASLYSPHFQVIERCLLLWNGEAFRHLLATHRQHLFPLILPPMIRHSKQHWNKNVQVFLYNSLRMTMEMDPALYEQISTPLQTAASITQAERERRQRVEQWQALERLVSN